MKFFVGECIDGKILETVLRIVTCLRKSRREVGMVLTIRMRHV